MTRWTARSLPLALALLLALIANGEPGSYHNFPIAMPQGQGIANPTPSATPTPTPSPKKLDH